MKALVYTVPAKMDGRKVIEPGKCELLEVEEPQMLPTDDMKIRVDHCAMCATDVHIVTMGLYGMPAPWVMGHEMEGTIVEVNPRAVENGFNIGDEVVINMQSCSCGKCDPCKRGNTLMCEHPTAGSYVHGFVEYCTAVCEQVYKIPKNSPVPSKYYCLSEPMASAMDGIDLAQIDIADSVLLQGCGAIGSIILNMLLLRGCTKVTVSDPIAEKRETALKLGAQYVIDPKNEDLKARAMEITEGRGYDLVFDVSGVPAAAPLLPELIGFRGTVVYFAVFPMDYELPLNLYDFYLKEARLQMVYTNYFNFPRVIDLIPRMNLEVIANREMKLSDGVEIFNAFLESKSNKIIVDCQA